MTKAYRLGELARRVGGTVEGDPEIPIRGVATLEQAGGEELSFLTHPRYRKAAATTRAAALLVGLDARVSGRTLLVAAEPYAALAELLELFHPRAPVAPGVSPDARLGQAIRLGRDVHVGPFAVVGDRVELADAVVVGAGCSVGDDCSIGAGTELRPHVVLYPGTQLGRRCLVHAGVVLGADGFGFAVGRQGHRKVPQVGRVVIEDDVEIGANTTVDRATLGETRIGEGSKIDDLVMIAHGVQLGPGALLAAQTGIAGSARLGARAALGGQAGVGGHIELGRDVKVAAKSAVFGDVADGAFVAGVPAIDHRRWKRAQALVAKLPELRRELELLRARLAALEQRLERGADG